MVFSSISFLLFFLPCLLVCYFLVPQRFRNLRNMVLLAFSLIFYGWGGPSFLLLMLASIALNYICGLFCGGKKLPKWVRAMSVFIAVAGGIGMLGYFKYAGFMAEIVNKLGFMVPIPEVVLPIGISFYTFQGLSYVIDVYRGDAKVQTDPIKVALYIALFPQLVAGPIVRYTTVAHDIVHRKESLEDVSAGIVRFIYGFAKKMVIANVMGSVTDQIFSMPAESISAAVAWVGAIAYAAQIYFDFSAYSDMAIGLGRVFGFRFEENFNYPYISKSVTEFWRRWHISLSTWFRDYVYIPLGGSYKSKFRQVFNMFIVWSLTGLWHGAALNFVLWGLWFFVLLLGEKYIWKKVLKILPGAFGWLYTMLAVVIGWVFFRAADMGYGLTYTLAMFGGNGVWYHDHAVYFIVQYWPEFLLAILASFPFKVWLHKALSKRAYDEEGNLINVDGKIRFSARIAHGIIVWWPKISATVLLIIAYSKLATGSFNPFIYFRF